MEEHRRFLAALDGLALPPPQHPQQPQPEEEEGAGAGVVVVLPAWRGDEWAALAAAVGGGRTAQEVREGG